MDFCAFTFTKSPSWSREASLTDKIWECRLIEKHH